MRLYVLSGEASGDLHAANLVRALQRRQQDLVVRAWGGDQLRQVGAEVVKDYRELAFMGFVEVVAHLRTILRNLRFCKEDIRRWQPDAVLLVDYPGFNLRIAPYAKACGIPVIYYISPQVWAWKASRVKKIRRYVDLMLTILPFETDFYARYQYPVTYVGHPLLDVLDALEPDAKLRAQFSGDQPLVALIPGSRKQEIARMLPVMLEAARLNPQYQYAIAAAPGIDPYFYQPYLKDQTIPVVHGKTRMLMQWAQGALVTSGTATLETALSETPEVVCYRGGPLGYWIARQLVQVPYISLVNLILEEEAVPELIQGDLNPNNLSIHLRKMMEPGPYRETMLQKMRHLKDRLGAQGASDRAAQAILHFHRTGEMSPSVLA